MNEEVYDKPTNEGISEGGSMANGFTGAISSKVGSRFAARIGDERDRFSFRFANRISAARC